MHRKFALMAACILALSVTVPVYAAPDVATLPAATPNSALRAWAEEHGSFFESSGAGIMPMAEVTDLPNFGGTTSYSSAYVWFNYRDASGAAKRTYKKLGSDGWINFDLREGFDDYASAYYMQLQLDSSSLPSPGRYKVKVSYRANAGGMTYSNATLALYRFPSNASVESDLFTLKDFYQNYGDFYAESVIDIGSGNRLYINLFYAADQRVDAVSGQWTVSFESTSADPDLSGPGTSQADQQQGFFNGITSGITSIISDIADIISGLLGINQSVADASNTAHQDAQNVVNSQNQNAANIQQNADKNAQDIQDNQYKNAQDIQDNQDKNTNILTAALSSLGNFLIDGLKGLFIPSDQYFKDYFDDLYNWFDERLGFLMFPIDLIIRIADLFLNADEADCILPFPSITIMGEKLWEDQSFNLTEFLEQNFGIVLTAIRLVTSIYLVISFVQLCEEKWEEVMTK